MYGDGRDFLVGMNNRVGRTATYLPLVVLCCLQFSPQLSGKLESISLLLEHIHQPHGSVQF